MFKLIKAPTMEQFGPYLGELGFQVTDDNQIRGIHDNKFFDYFYSESDDLNNRRKETVHEAVREIIASTLAKYDIVPVHVVGTQTYMNKPEAPHVTLLATAIGKLAEKKDVIVVIGEAGGGSSGQDAGIWAYRSLMREGGLEKGSAVGLTEMLRKMGKELKVEGDEEGKKAEAGVVILNPGALLYSHKEKKAMTQTSWMGRQKKDSLTAGYEVDEKWNKVAMHTTATEHIKTVLAHVLPKHLNKKARVHILCVGESAKDTIDYLDDLFTKNPDDKDLAAKLQSIVLIEPIHKHEELQSAKFKYFLRKRGIAFVESETVPVSGLVATPDKTEERKMGDSWVKVDNNASDSNNEAAIQDRIDSIVAKTTDLDPADDNDAPPAPVSTHTYSASDLDHTTELIVPEILNRALGYISRHMSSREDFLNNDADGKVDEVIDKLSEDFDKTQRLYPDIMNPIIQAARDEYEEEGKEDWAMSLMLDMESLQRSPEKQ
ncbi:hypothetical protein M409DRAFT_26445 [Zasmidium cellare ATCC 36951]|uniref:Arb2 domain-containing protein n=1 Tax=Zasmidium cellare ATCC 36951 TaxID=1080233 RepID=A0A6A6C734_ZASCE|nr:uncharacterized protein M409DRAFT_26445 [Zasmidium cellare ATCC 36951]KAF2162997.1 hypothetical protein M409DRAFT_26445 [Zasmidium cellare ATCC 36951]